MKAMILAAGLGTRLRPLTDDRPKALVEVAERTMLEIALCRLREFGVREVIVNVHHFADMVVEYLKKNDNFGMRIEVSREDVLLDTGGGLKKAAWFFQENSTARNVTTNLGNGLTGSLPGPEGLKPASLAAPNGTPPPQNAKSGRSGGPGEAVPFHKTTDEASSSVLGEPFILHNVDVISAIDLGRMVQFHRDNRALATLAVQERETSRYLLFDEEGQLCGRRAGGGQPDQIVRSSRQIQALAFCGIHVISPRLLTLMTEEGVFSIIDSYLRLAAAEEKILAFRADEYHWRDLGKPESLQQVTHSV